MPQKITADEGLRYPIPLYDKTAMVINFACPTCQIAGKLVEMTTDDAKRMHWSNDANNPQALKVEWTGLRCPECGRSFTMEATKAFPSGPAL